MPREQRTLRIEFQSAEAFQREFDSNLSNGGAFVRTEDEFELREQVFVQLAFVYVGKTLDLEAEIVHIVPPGMANAGAAPGVAVQLSLSVHELRGRLDAFDLASGSTDHQSDAGTRGARRTPVRVEAKIQGDHDVVSGQTRNLSLTGVLVGVGGHAVPLGENVSLLLQHPTTGEERSIQGTVVRQIESDGEVAAVAVHFTHDEDEREDVTRFIESLQGAEHTRRLGGISGPIEELGPQSLLQMFATSSPAGTLMLRRDQEEGLICFEAGLLRLAQLGATTGMKALIRLLSWREGVFEFNARIEAREMKDPPLPLEAALFDAVRQIDEGAQVDSHRFPLQAQLAIVPGADFGEFSDPSKVESAVIDLARAGFTVQRVLEVIPEPDPEIFRAFQTLVEAELITFDS